MVFVLLGQSGNSLDVASILVAGPVTGTRASVVFVLAVIGLGTKAAFLPWHVWLPEAHPAAPSPVSAVMSGVTIKRGIYGIVMMLGFLGSPPAWWGWLLVVIERMPQQFV